MTATVSALRASPSVLAIRRVPQPLCGSAGFAIRLCNGVADGWRREPLLASVITLSTTLAALTPPLFVAPGG